MINLVMSLPSAKTEESQKHRILESVSFLVSALLRPVSNPTTDAEAVLRLAHRETCITRDFLVYLAESGAIDRTTSDHLSRESEYLRSKLSDHIRAVSPGTVRAGSHAEAISPSYPIPWRAT